MNALDSSGMARGGSRGSRALRAIVIALTLALTMLPAVPAQSHGPYSYSDDGDYAITMTDGTTVTARMVRPSGTAPTGGWPLVVYMAGDRTGRCADLDDGVDASWYTRQQMAADGFVVLSFNPRGLPSTNGTSECNTALADAKDAIDDSGWDAGGPKDVQDVKDLISWSLSSYSPGGCGSPCIDSDEIGMVAGREEANRAWLTAVSDSRIKAIVPVGSRLDVREVSSISNKPLDLGHQQGMYDADKGRLGHADSSVAENWAAMLRARYLNLTVPTATETWFDARTVVSDDSAVDKAHLLTSTAVFVVHAWRDPHVSPLGSIEAYNKLPGNNAAKYLYLGACGSDGKCATGNASALRSRVHAFLDRHVRGDTGVTVGGPIFYAVPPTSPNTTDNWTVQTTSSWPLPGTNHTYCLGSDGTFTATGCPATATSDVLIGNGPLLFPPATTCMNLKYVSGEFKEYTSWAVTNPVRVGDISIDMHMSSSTTRMQVYVDVFDVDGSGIETAVWQGSAVQLPTARNQAAGTKVNFVFKPGGTAFTLATGHKLRLRIASNRRGVFSGEPLLGTYTIHHSSSFPTKVTLRLV